VEIRQHQDVRAFAELAEPVVHADPARHTLAVTVLAAQLRSPVTADLVTMATLHEGGSGTVRGAALRQRGWSLITSALPPDQAPAVAGLLQAVPEPPTGASGPVPTAEAFADAWCRCTGAIVKTVMAMRLFRLGELRPPQGVPGASRVATMDDIELLARWRLDFATAAMPWLWPHADDVTALTTRQLAAGQGNLLWEVHGEPVAVASASVPVAGMSRLASVWTPPEHRGRGFGSAVTAAASRWALDAGVRHVVLFTDLANPVSNSIYPKLGYRPVHDAADLLFEQPA